MRAAGAVVATDGGRGGPVDAADVTIDDTIGRTGSTDLQGYLDYARTHLGGLRVVIDLSDLPAPSAGVRPLTEDLLVVGHVFDPANTLSAQANIAGISSNISSLRADSLGAGPAVDVPASNVDFELVRISIGNTSADPASVGLRSEAAITRVHDVLLTPAAISAQIHNVTIGTVTDTILGSTEHGLQVTGTTGALGLEVKAALPGGSPTPPSYNGVSVTGTVDEVLIALDASGVGGPGQGSGVFIDPAIVAPKSAVVIRNSTSTPGPFLRATGLDGTDGRVFITGSTPDRGTTAIGGIEYSDAGDELEVAFTGIVPVTSSVPSESPLSSPVLPRATMESWEIDTSDPVEVIWRYIGKETILGRFAWGLTAKKASGGSDDVTFCIEKITGGPTPVPDTEVTRAVTTPAETYARAGGTVTITEGDEFRFRLTNASTTTSILIEKIDVEVLRV